MDDGSWLHTDSCSSSATLCWGIPIPSGGSPKTDRPCIFDDQDIAITPRTPTAVLRSPFPSFGSVEGEAEELIFSSVCSQPEPSSFSCHAPAPPSPPSSNDSSHHSRLSGKRFLEHVSSSDADSSNEEPQTQRMRRGEHVKGRTDMQEKARSGQRHWAGMVVELREEWERKRVGEFNPHFVRQLSICEHRRLKPQRECILLLLQIAAADGIIVPFFMEAQTPSLGWGGFRVLRSLEFRARVNAMFQSNCASTTINNTFRRAGLVADGHWDQAFRGHTAFVVHP
eukprot:CAMPEP_0181306892 /NCGR_PEP_ID=MMETSP1101-20121128/10559_1 /TAXON_ID=46948 /ORGANISM="Rhodomonas abbreviata, Strain Caron Lab Isolate" /LENGTH=282 /DNA_ID=CAMNT_0023413013 /DNA_START=177 /DNA_END=1025 /DNA_ORIENTATION=+